MAFPSTKSIPLRLRISLAYALLMVALVGTVGLYLVSTIEGTMLQDQEESLRFRAAQVEREIGPDSTGGALHPSQVSRAIAELAPLEEFAAPGIYVQVRDPSGTILATSANLPSGSLPAPVDTVDRALAGEESFTTVPAGRERVRLLVKPLRGGGGVVGIMLVGESMHIQDTIVRRTQQLMAFAAASAAVTALLGGWWLASRALGPIAAVTEVAAGIAATGHFERRVPLPPTQDELRALAVTFNDMIDRLDATFRLQRDFLADASHELRGPLMVIRGNLDLLKMDLPLKEREVSAREATEEVERMSRLVSDLLFLGEVDAREAARQEQVELRIVLKEVWERAEAVDGSTHELSISHDESAMVTGDRDRLIQMLWNMVENALRYTPAGGKVTLALRNHGQVAELSVTDTGIGIPREHLPQLFERFYRVDRSRSRSKGGTGLGLSIVKQIAEIHGGQVRVHSEPAEGSVFTVVLPTISASDDIEKQG